MDEKQLQALSNELAKNLKTTEDLSQFDRLLKSVSNRRLGEKSGVAGNPVFVPEMDDAVEGLTNSNEPLYYRVR